MGLNHVRIEIRRRRVQLDRQRKAIQALAKAGISTVSAEAMLAQILERLDKLCAERGRLVGEGRLSRPTYASGKIINGPTARR